MYDWCNVYSIYPVLVHSLLLVRTTVIFICSTFQIHVHSLLFVRTAVIFIALLRFLSRTRRFFFWNREQRSSEPPNDPSVHFFFFLVVFFLVVPGNGRHRTCPQTFLVHRRLFTELSAGAYTATLCRFMYTTLSSIFYFRCENVWRTPHHA